MAGDTCANDGPFKGICTKVEADSAFMFLGFIVLLVILGLTLITRRSGGGNKKGNYGATTV